MLGFLGPLLGAITGIGGIAGKAAGGAQAGRESQNQQMLSADQLRNQQYATQQNALLQLLGLDERALMDRAGLDLQRRQFDISSRGANAKQGLLGALLAGYQPVQMTGIPSRVAASMPKISGGMSMNAQARQIAQMLANQGQAALANPQPHQALPEGNYASRGMLQAPMLSQLKQPGMLEKILGGVGLAGSLLGGINATMPQGQRPVGMTPPYAGGMQNPNGTFGTTIRRGVTFG